MTARDLSTERDLATNAVVSAAWYLHLHMYPSPDGTEATCPADIYKSLCDALEKLNALDASDPIRLGEDPK